MLHWNLSYFSGLLMRRKLHFRIIRELEGSFQCRGESVTENATLKPVNNVQVKGNPQFRDQTCLLQRELQRRPKMPAQTGRSHSPAENAFRTDCSRSGFCLTFQKSPILSRKWTSLSCYSVLTGWVLRVPGALTCTHTASRCPCICGETQATSAASASLTVEDLGFQSS